MPAIVNYASRFVIYAHRGFIRLATGWEQPTIGVQPLYRKLSKLGISNGKIESTSDNGLARRYLGYCVGLANSVRSKNIPSGREPCSSGYGRRLMFQRLLV